MTRQSALNVRLVLGQGGGNSLGQSRLAMSEVQICGIPKLSSLEVAPTPKEGLSHSPDVEEPLPTGERLSCVRAIEDPWRVKTE